MEIVRDIFQLTFAPVNTWDKGQTVLTTDLKGESITESYSPTDIITEIINNILSRLLGTKILMYL